MAKMHLYCRVDGCKSSTRQPETRLFTFPKPRKTCLLWVAFTENAALKERWSKTGNLPRTCNRICSLHFQDKDFTNCWKERLNRGAVPSLKSSVGPTTPPPSPPQASFQNDEWITHELNKLNHSTDVVSGTQVDKSRKYGRRNVNNSSDEDEAVEINEFCDQPSSPPPEDCITDTVLTDKDGNTTDEKAPADVGNVTESPSVLSSNPEVFKEKTLESNTLDAITRRLVRLEKKVDEIYNRQIEIMQRIYPENSRVLAPELGTPEHLRVPFQTQNDVGELLNL